MLLIITHDSPYMTHASHFIPKWTFFFCYIYIYICMYDYDNILVLLFFFPPWLTAVIFVLKPTCFFISIIYIRESLSVFGGKRDQIAHDNPISFIISSSNLPITILEKKRKKEKKKKRERVKVIYVGAFLHFCLVSKAICFHSNLCLPPSLNW